MHGLFLIDVCTTCYKRPPVLGDRFCWAEGVKTTDTVFHDHSVSTPFTFSSSQLWSPFDMRPLLCCNVLPPGGLQTNLSNNNNKYYLIQLLEDDNRKQYSVWLHWGRVGMKGQNNLFPCGPDLDEAKTIFCKKLASDTSSLRGAIKVLRKFF